MMSAIDFDNYSYPDDRGRFGPYGGRFVPETLIPALTELERVFLECREDPG
ncbi:MAG: tryptophan synthase subunit beta, partial [Candidatus Delongbacteria bacterium]